MHEFSVDDLFLLRARGKVVIRWYIKAILGHERFGDA